MTDEAHGGRDVSPPRHYFLPEAEPPAGPYSAGPTADQIAAATGEGEVFRLGVAALVPLSRPQGCLAYDRDDLGQLRLVQRWIAPEGPLPTASPLAIADQVQGWWMARLQAAGGSGPLPGCRPAPLGGQPGTFVVPLLAGELLHGMVVLQDCAGGTLDPDAEREVVAIATAMSLALYAFVLKGRLAEAVLPEQVAEAITQERRRIARDIHDGVAQSLAYLLLKAELLDRLIERDPAGAREQASLLRTSLQQAVTELRRCIGDLRRPSTGQIAGITGQLRTLVSSLGELPNLELAMQQVSGVRLAPEVERTVIGIVRESLHNIRKHAAANSVRVEVQQEGEHLRVLVQDDGKGFQPGQGPDDPDLHFGVKQMRELAQELGGDVTITSAPGAGARVEASIPLTPGRADPR